MFNKNLKNLFKIIFIIFCGILLWGCSSSEEITIQDPQERLSNAIEMYNNEDYLDAVNEFQALILQYPGNSIVDDAQYYLGMSRFKRGEYILGAYEFSRLIKNMTASEFIPEAQYMLAECYYQLSPHFSLDQKYTEKSIEEFQAFIDFFPTNAKVPDAEKKIKELNEKLAHKEFNSAYIYERLEDYKAAMFYYENVIETYHDTKYAPMAMYNRIKILIDKEDTNTALAEMNKFLDRYPDDPNAAEIKKMKSSLENKLSASK